MKKAILVGLLALGCAAGGPAAPELTVELDAFSGRPNPTWTLTAAEAGEVLERLRGLPAASASIPDLGLGYRGFVLRGEAEELPGRAYVTSGLIALGDPERPTVVRDAHDLEPFLIGLARARGYQVVGP